MTDLGKSDEKLDEKIREKALDTLRSKGPQITREKFDKALCYFPGDRVDQVIAFYSGCITRGSQAVSLSRDSFVKDRSPE